MNFFEFEIPAYTTSRDWAVYIIVATHKINKNKLLYVGKVGDNRDGCNPIISRIGNHFSFTKGHSQLRNKISDTTNFNYKIYYCTIGIYNESNNYDSRGKINEVERRLNIIVQSKLIEKKGEFKLLNHYKGWGINKENKDKRQKILTEDEVKGLEKLADNALEN